MIRSMCGGMAGMLWLVSTVWAQPPISPAMPAPLGWQARPRAWTAPAVSERIMAAARQPASAFDELRLRVVTGDTVQVVDTSGQETRGRVTGLSDAALTLSVEGAPRIFMADEVRRVDRRRRDSVWNGVLMGAGVGALAGFVVGRRIDSPSCPRPGIECGQGAAIGTYSGAVWGALGGWITDALIQKRETVYTAPTYHPDDSDRGARDGK